MIFTNSKIYDAATKSFKNGTIEVENGIIKNISFGEPEFENGAIDMKGAMLIPGFIDAHTHGRNGFDFNTASAEDMKTMAKRYLSMEMKFRYNITNATTEPHIKFYYITDVDSKYSESKTILVYLDGLSSDGEWQTVTVDLKGLEPWQTATALTGLRFDPFNGYGEMEVDYIRFIEDPSYVYVPIEEIPMSITNGDAEDEKLNPFRSNNAKIVRIEDPDKKGNHIWHIDANDGSQYVYFRYDARYKQGATYKISFDINLRVGIFICYHYKFAVFNLMLSKTGEFCECIPLLIGIKDYFALCVFPFEEL